MIITTKPIKLIGWWLVLGSSFYLIFIAFIKDHTVAKVAYDQATPYRRIFYFMWYFGHLVNMISGIAILKRKNWGRYSFLIWGIIYFCFGIFTEPSTTDVIRWLAFYLSFCFFLFRPKANEYFNEKVIKLYRE